jgi:hypothetical protein
MTDQKSARPVAIVLALLLLVVVVLAIAGTARGSDRQELAAAKAIRAEFGTGWLAGCFLAIADRETGHTFDPRSANWHDHHSDGSVGSFGLLQIGALWRARGESVAAFSRRMFDPVQNAELAHRLYRLYGIAPWRSC